MTVHGARSTGKRAALAWGHPLDGEAAGSPCRDTRSKAGKLQRATPENPVRCRLARRLERIGARHGPGVVEARVVGAVEQLAGPQRGIKLRERPYLRRRCPFRKMNRAEVARMLESSSGDQFA